MTHVCLDSDLGPKVVPVYNVMCWACGYEWRVVSTDEDAPPIYCFTCPACSKMASSKVPKGVH